MSTSHEPTMTGTKKCANCEKVLPVICFAVHKRSNDGLAYECRECAKERTKKLKPKKGMNKKKLIAMTRFYEFHKID